MSSGGVESKITDALRKLIDKRRDPEFMERLRRRIEQDKPLLDRLAVLEHEEQNRVTASVMDEIRRLAFHECRYPPSNGAGFPIDQCLDCGRWDGE